jgi:gamma-glutamylcyclotransferase (GGCT)/AIG2-like uncharacterized protein YtfP
VTVLTLDGRPLVVRAYRVQEPQGFSAPSPGYLDAVGRARKALGLGTTDLVEAAQGQPVTPTGRLFAYGTLMRGESRFFHVEPECLASVLLAQAPGVLHDLGEFPGMVMTEQPGACVRGELLRHCQPGRWLSTIDRMEGFRSHDSPDNRHRRVLLDVSTDEGVTCRAWCYVHAGPLPAGTRIPSGDWREYRGTRRRFLSRLVDGYCGNRELEVARDLVRRSGVVDSTCVEEATRRLLPLAGALDRGDVSERALALATGKAAVIP